jgi:23S rRNA maturation-related 3'-5' exoribonuclease YhaM
MAEYDLSGATPDPLSADEVVRRLPAIELLSDSLQEPVIEISRRAPDYFWEVPATSSKDVDYHHPIARREHGLWAHTLMLFGPLWRLSQSEVALGNITERERDLAFAAAILHDQRKRGRHDDPESKAASDHDLRMAIVIRQADFPGADAVANAVASHMGPSEWGYDDPEPETPLQHLVHRADMMASMPNADIHVPGPIPKELADLGLEAGSYE